MPLDQNPEPKSPIEQRTEDMRMTFGEHLEELRSCIIRALLGLVVALIGTLYFGQDIVALLTSPLNQVQAALGYPPQAIVTDPTGGFVSTYLKVSIISALIIASPWIVYQLWRFTSEGLYENEKKFVYILAPFSTVMTALGLAFTYFILLPVCLIFFLSFLSTYPKINTSYSNPLISVFIKTTAVAGSTDQSGNDESNIQLDTNAVTYPTIPVVLEDPKNPPTGAEWYNATERRRKLWTGSRLEATTYFSNDRIINPLYDVNDYISFTSLLTFGACVGFQLPVVMLLVGYTHLVDPTRIASVRKYAFFACFAAGAILTPADIFSMLLLAIPLYGLFEFGLLLMKMVDSPPENEADLPE
ncbi:Sec-independent protein translocase protein TatC [Poriferisphaera corsica]|uniref:Sec-independent protein translocase protein TatC n=1 Tax=Poriferisphaera corsica TaxID=2528020 RepID=A0A517YSE5_9BACT|nr:twin-arginine translocase subunit TatC [Poriferisphaera corsica]QDU33138.1 Sec-independent protein translocase protein TatC [Poriferisphaera corsica]